MNSINSINNVMIISIFRYLLFLFYLHHVESCTTDWTNFGFITQPLINTIGMKFMKAWKNAKFIPFLKITHAYGTILIFIRGFVWSIGFFFRAPCTVLYHRKTTNGLYP